MAAEEVSGNHLFIGERWLRQNIVGLAQEYRRPTRFDNPAGTRMPSEDALRLFVQRHKERKG